MVMLDSEVAGRDDLRSGLRGGGFRPFGRRRARMLVGALLSVLAIGGNLLVYSSMDTRIEVLQAVRDIPAGTQISLVDLRPVEVWLDPTVNAVRSDQAASLIGGYAKVRLVAGSLVVNEAVQRQPLVAPDAAVVSVQISEGSVPLGLRERSHILVVVPPPPFSDAGVSQVLEAVVVGLPTTVAGATGRVAISLEVAIPAAVEIAGADDVRILLLDPSWAITIDDRFIAPTQEQGS
jgi:hypothetical protein